MDFGEIDELHHGLVLVAKCPRAMHEEPRLKRLDPPPHQPPLRLGHKTTARNCDAQDAQERPRHRCPHREEWQVEYCSSQRMLARGNVVKPASIRQVNIWRDLHAWNGPSATPPNVRPPPTEA